MIDLTLLLTFWLVWLGLGLVGLFDYRPDRTCGIAFILLCCTLWLLLFVCVCVSRLVALLFFAQLPFPYPHILLLVIYICCCA